MFYLAVKHLYPTVSVPSKIKGSMGDHSHIKVLILTMNGNVGQFCLGEAPSITYTANEAYETTI